MPALLSSAFWGSLWPECNLLCQSLLCYSFLHELSQSHGPHIGHVSLCSHRTQLYWCFILPTCDCSGCSYGLCHKRWHKRLLQWIWYLSPLTQENIYRIPMLTFAVFITVNLGLCNSCFYSLSTHDHSFKYHGVQTFLPCPSPLMLADLRLAQ